ncbi:MAG TPA: hypothetical protein VGM10_04340 [Actinocrinis sp.]|jgi:hypothetical protein
MWSYDDGWSDRRKWYESEDQYVRRQRAEGEQRAVQADARLRTSLRQVSQEKDALARQLADLGAAFDAYVELTSVRAHLARFTAATAARDRARALLADLHSPEPAGPPDPRTAPAGSAGRPDPLAVPGYWLPSAASGLEAAVRGDGQAGDEDLEAAAGCDEQRTAVFLSLALPLAGRAGLSVPWLVRALGPGPSSPMSEVIAAVREIWRQAGRGGYGETGRAAVVHWLAGVQCPETVDQFYATFGLRRVPSGALDTQTRLAQVRAAAAALADLRRRFSAEPPAPSPGRTAAAAEPTDLVEASAAPSLTLLEALIAEGSPEEAELILHAQELAAEVRKRRTHEAVEPAARWDAPAGTVLALLEADLQESSAQHAGLRAIAQAALCQTAASLAERLLAEAAPDPAATRISLRLDGQNLELLVDQPLDPQLRELDAAVERRYAPEPGRMSRRHVAEAALQIAERNERNRSNAQAAIDQFIAARAELGELRQAAQREYTALLDRLGELAEHEYTP